MMLLALVPVRHCILRGLLALADSSAASELFSRSVSRRFRHRTLAPGFIQSSQWLKTTNQERSRFRSVNPCLQREEDRRGWYMSERPSAVT